MPLLCCLVTTPAAAAACQELEAAGFSLCREPSPEISGLVLDVPRPRLGKFPGIGSRRAAGSLAGI